MSIAWPKPVDDATTLVRDIVAEFRERDVPFMAGSLAYSAFVSLLPFMLLVVIAVSWIGGEQLVAVVLSLTRRYLSPAGQNVVFDALTHASGRFGLSVLGLLALSWGALTLFRRLDTAFAQLYGTDGRGSIRDQIRDALIVIAAMAGAMLAMLFAGLVFAMVPQIPFLGVLNVLFLIAALSAAFYPVYYVFPDVAIEPLEAVPGVIVSVVGWTILQLLFQVYISISSTAELYGVLGGVLLLITWLYFASLIFLLGGVTNVVLAGRRPPNAGLAYEGTDGDAGIG
ncbi:YihY/virulence factor BrkB family protein (plasmid) [Halorientalis pallida]|uniref:YihY/virulence factor BrkB family protein n=1 Tax=Halorientalis pallida TaxID=2479928 RepID=UPI003C6FE728